MEYTHVTHEAFGPEYDSESRILVLGSVPSVKSREAAFYYGHPMNRFWKLMVVLTELQNEPLADEARVEELAAALPPRSWGKNEADLEKLRAAYPTFPWTREEKRRFLHAHNIAAWDTISECDIRGSSDASIRSVIPADIPMILAAAPIERILCNGATSFQHYMKYVAPQVDAFYAEHPTDTRAEVVKLPSTSPANAAWSIPRLVSAWRPAF